MPIQVKQIFLSYSRPDQGQVERIGERLAKAYRVWFDRAKLIPGENWSDKLDEALRASSHCLVFVGAEQSRPWQRDEVRTAINRAVTEVDGFRLIPVLLPDARGRPGESELPSFLTNPWLVHPLLPSRAARGSEKA